jgi:hypothetical protein
MFMNRSLLLVLMMISLAAQGQDMPVQWSYSSKKLNPTSYEVKISAVVDEGWHIYSQYTPDGGPVPTAISFVKNPLVALQGKVKEAGKMEEYFEPLFGVQVKQFSDKVDFVQVVNLKPGIKTALKGSVEFMVCNDHECMPPKKQNFSINLPK